MSGRAGIKGSLPILADPGTGSGTITWKDNSGSEAEYVVLESSDGQTFDEIGSVSSDETSFDLTDLPESSQLIYRIRARKTGNTGDSILTPLVTLGVNDLQVEDDFPKFEFSGVSGVKQRLVVKFNEDINGSLQSSDIHLDNLNTDQAVPITDSDWTYNSTTKTLTITFADEVNDPGSVGGPITGALADGNYQLRLLAGDIAAAGVPLTNDIDHEFFFLNGDADHNRIVDVLDLVILNDNWFGTGKTFGQGDFNYDGAVNQWDLGIMSLKWQGTMPLPGVFNVFVIGPNQLSLTWDDTETGEDGWIIQRADDGESWANYETLLGDHNGFDDTALPDGTRFSYRVRPFGAGITTPYSAKRSATTPLASPSYLDAVELSSGEVSLSWLDNSVSKDGYVILRSQDAGQTWTQVGTTGPDETYFETPVSSWDPAPLFQVHAFQGDPMAISAESGPMTPPDIIPKKPIVTSFLSPSPTNSTTGILGVTGSAPRGEQYLKYHWQCNQTPIGAPPPTFSANGTNGAKNTTVTVYKAGNYYFRAFVENDGVFTETPQPLATLVVNQTATSMIITPGVAEVYYPVQLTAVVLDQFGDPLTTQPTIEWAMESGDGTVTSYGAYIGQGSYNGTVRASGGGTTQTALMVHQKQKITPNFSSVAAPTAITNQVPQVTLSASGSAHVESVGYLINGIQTSDGNQFGAHNIYMDFAHPVKNVTFWMNGTFNVDLKAYSGATLVHTQNFSGTAESIPVALGASYAITRIELIRQSGSPSYHYLSFDFVPRSLNTDFNNDGTINVADELINDTGSGPSAIFMLNDDDDDLNGVLDWVQAGAITGENDLVRMDIQPPVGVTSGTLTLAIAEGANRVRVWASSDRDASGPLLGLGAESSKITWNIGSQPQAVWIEGCKAGLDSVRFALAVRPTGTPDGPDAAEFARGTVVGVKVNKVWSDRQLNGSVYNFLPNGNFGGTGWQGTDLETGKRTDAKPYILMATRDSDDRLYVKADVTITPDTPAIRSRLLFRMIAGGKLGSVALSSTVLDDSATPGGGLPGGSLIGNVASMSAGIQTSTISTSYIRVGWGVDYNSNGKLDLAGANFGEVRGIGNMQIGAVDQGAYDNAMSALTAFRSTLGNLTARHASDFLFAFQTDQGLTGAINTPTTASVGEYKLTHNVGAVFSNASLPSATVNKARFTMTSGSPLVTDIANSGAIAAMFGKTLFTKRDIIKAWFDANPLVNSHSFTFSPTKPEIAFGKLADWDLSIAIGNAIVSGMTFTVDVQRTIPYLGYEILKSTSFSLGGVLTDLYDFDYDTETPADYAAQVQAGYNGIGRSAGHIFKIEADFTGSAAVPGDLIYALYPVS